jgi:hypothetical protein
MAASEGYLVTETVRTVKKQVIKLLVAIDPDNPEYEDKIIIRAKEVKKIAMRHLKPSDFLKKGYATVYDQCSQEVRDKLKLMDN